MTTPALVALPEEGSWDAAAAGVQMVFQPVIELASGHVVGHEALARGPKGSAVELPDALFAAARRAGRLTELDWACRTAAFRDSRAAGMPERWRLFVNAEPLALNTACPTALLADWVDAHRHLNVVVEITERRLMHRPADLIRVVSTLRELGWEVALDDTGANDASVALLPLVQPDVVKLDRHLLGRQLSPSGLETLRTILRYVERSGAILLAEGVETDEDLVRARSLGAVWGQGYLLGRPLPLPGPTTHIADASAGDSATAWDFDAEATSYHRLAQDLPSLVVSPEWLNARLADVCRDAAAAPNAAVLLLSLGTGTPASDGLLATLAQLQDVCALVWVETAEPCPNPPPTLRISQQLDRAASADVAAVFLSPTSACALSAVRRDDGRFDTAISNDHARVAVMARRLLRRVPPR